MSRSKRDKNAAALAIFNRRQSASSGKTAALSSSSFSSSSSSSSSYSLEVNNAPLYPMLPREEYQNQHYHASSQELRRGGNNSNSSHSYHLLQEQQQLQRGGQERREGPLPLYGYIGHKMNKMRRAGSKSEGGGRSQLLRLVTNEMYDRASSNGGSQGNLSSPPPYYSSSSSTNIAALNISGHGSGSSRAVAVTSNRTALPEYSHSHSEEVPPPLYERSQSISNLAISAAGGSARGSGNNVVSTSSPTPPSPTASSVSSPSMSESGTNNLEEVSSYLISQLKKKPKKEQQLKEAQEIQSQIENLELTLDTAEVEGTAKRRLLNLEIEELQTKLAETKKEIAKVEEDLEELRKTTKSEVEKLRASPKFKDRQRLDKLQREIDNINLHSNKVIKTVNSIQEPEDLAASDCAQLEDDTDFLCPICYRIPDGQIMTCQACDNMVCGTCRDKLTTCPTCRKKFNLFPPKRNRLAERLMAARIGKLV